MGKQRARMYVHSVIYLNSSDDHPIVGIPIPVFGNKAAVSESSESKPRCLGRRKIAAILVLALRAGKVLGRHAWFAFSKLKIGWSRASAHMAITLSPSLAYLYLSRFRFVESPGNRQIALACPVPLERWQESQPNLSRIHQQWRMGQTRVFRLQYCCPKEQQTHTATGEIQGLPAGRQVRASGVPQGFVPADFQLFVLYSISETAFHLVRRPYVHRPKLL